AVDLAHAGPPTTPGLALVETLERTLLRRGSRPCPLDAADAADAADLPTGRPAQEGELVVDLTGAPSPRAGALAPTFDGLFGDDARDAILLDGRAPWLELVDPAAAPPLSFGRALPAVDRPWTLRFGRAAVATRIATLIEAALSRTPPIPFRASAPAARGRARGPSGFARDLLADGIRRRLTRLVVDDHHWRIGWRAVGPGGSTLASGRWPAGARWRWLMDDRRRYYADPFPFERDGRTFAFCEDYRYATGLGALCVFEVDSAGAPGPVRTILEENVHFSYPFVFEHAGETWMMPETSGARELRLYRATRFPDRWTLDRTLMSGISVSDATIIEDGGRHWLLATTDEGGSSWDCLSVFSGHGPLGPWTREGDGPALIDASSARPAGRMSRVGGELRRPVQDCTTGYGGGLAICRIDALGGPGAFAQTVLSRLEAPAGAGAHGVHTLNLGGGFEFIDALIPRRWRGDPERQR
ncbi:MAG: formyl transferase, partial [Hyphomicrobiales bacterium]|nr:formyl transferase [Hyphomicrobiales bacterium]